MMKSPSLLLVEDQQLMRLGLRLSLERMGCYQVLGEAADGESAISAAQKLQPEIVLMDVGLPGMDGIEATWRIKQLLPRTRIVMFTSHTEADKVTAALGAGADGYCAKETPVDQIAGAIDTVMRGEIWLDPSIAEMVVRDNRAKKAGDRVKLSETETRILSLMSKGSSNEEIAANLNTTPGVIARRMHDIIGRFIENTTSETISDKNDNGFAGDWLTVFIDGLNDGKIFADKYLLENLLGSGGIGAVFKARHVYMDRHIALKMLRPEYAQDRHVMRNFQREARAIANVQHPNIVAVHDFGVSSEGEPFLAMEYVDGPNLSEIMLKQKQLPVNRIVRLCTQVADGLSEAHSRGIIHCDLKPSNILLQNSDQGEVAKLVDFGVAQMVSRDPDERATDKFYVCGTPYYMSPEQCSGKRVDLRTDIYSLGCILYEALTGRNPFGGPTTMETFAKHRELVAPPMSTIYPPGRFTLELEACVGAMLAKDARERPASMKEVVRMLGALDLSSTGAAQ